MNERQERLGTENIWKLMLTMGIPTFIAQLVNLFYNIIDRMFIGHIAQSGTNALTGVGVCLPITLMIAAFSAFVGAGGAPLATISLGKGEPEKAKKILGNSVVMLFAFSVILTTLFLCVKKPILYLVGASDVTYPFANEYITIYLLGTISVMFTLGLNTFITAQGQAKIAMCSILLGAVTNIVLDPILIFVCKMGVRGAAIATVISQTVSAIWVLAFLCGKKASLRIERVYVKPDVSIMCHIGSLGISPFVMQSTESLISLVLNNGLATYGGDLYVASLTILQSVIQLITTPINGFTQGVQPIISYNYGAGNVERVKETLKRLFVLVTSVAALIALSAIVFPRKYGSLFTNDVQLLNLVEEILPVFVFGMLIFGVQMSCQTAFMGMGQAKISLFVALLRKVILLIPLAILLPRITGNVMGIYYSEPIADMTAATICGILFYKKLPGILAKKA